MHNHQAGWRPSVVVTHLCHYSNCAALCCFAVKSMRYNEGALLFTIRSLNRCLRSLPAHTEAICRYEFASRAPRLCTRLQALLTAQPDSARLYGSAGFLRTLQKLFPTTEDTLLTFTGATTTRPASVVADTSKAQGQAQAHGGKEPEPVPEPDRPQEQVEPQSSSEDDSDL